jgi:cell wall-associated NlpC family hydrolase
MEAQVQKTLRAFAYAIPALLIAVAFALGASATAQASTSGAPVAAAANAVDGYCDPFNDIDDPDCWEDGENWDGNDWTDDPGGNAPVGNAPGDPGEYLPPVTAPTGPTKPPIFTPPTIKWPAPPKGAYAKLRANGRTAVAPKAAPKPIKAMIHAANSITHKPYVWGGGHGRWYDRGYDCSGATSFVLRAGGYLNSPLVSGDLARWGARGGGNWVRIYANSTHVFIVIAGLRFDTSSYGAGGGSGPRWRSTVRPTGGFRLRHPAGL